MAITVKTNKGDEQNESYYLRINVSIIPGPEYSSTAWSLNNSMIVHDPTTDEFLCFENEQISFKTLSLKAALFWLINFNSK